MGVTRVVLLPVVGEGEGSVGGSVVGSSEGVAEGVAVVLV